MSPHSYTGVGPHPNDEQVRVHHLNIDAVSDVLLMGACPIAGTEDNYLTGTVKIAGARLVLRGYAVEIDPPELNDETYTQAHARYRAVDPTLQPDVDRICAFDDGVLPHVHRIVGSNYVWLICATPYGES